MLTSDLLMYRTRKDRVRPCFVKADDPRLLSLAADLVASVGRGVGSKRGALEETLEALSRGYQIVRIARGLGKLLLDRAEFEEGDESAPGQRRQLFLQAAEILRDLPEDGDFGLYEERLGQRLPGPLEDLRKGLYGDLPAQRRLLSWRELSPIQLLERYNLAQAQGLVLRSRQLRIRTSCSDLLRVRRVLRWLKFCRLVAQVRRESRSWAIEVEGPAAMFTMPRKYGMQLATFLPAVPLLQRFHLEADIEIRGRGTYLLALSHRDPLVCPYQDALGHIPAEVASVAEKFEDDEWELDLTPEPRHVGPRDICVPDLGFCHRQTGLVVCFELFHRWHHGALQRRLDELGSRPDPSFFLGVDRFLWKRPEIRDRLAEHEQVMLFNSFPSVRGIKKILRRFPDGVRTDASAGP